MKDPIIGHRITWKFEDGPTAGTRFEHHFAEDGSVSYQMAGNTKTTTEKHYEVAKVSTHVFAVSYLASSGWTLTTVLDFESGKLVAFASNDKQLVVQHGTFTVLGKRAA